MKSFIAGLFFALVLTSPSIAQDKTEFSKIWDAGFNTYQSAEELLSNGDTKNALKRFKEALEQFKKIKSAKLTSWQDKIITYRMGLCKSNINAIVKSINTGTPVEEVSNIEPEIQKDVIDNEKELQELKKHRQSIEETLKVYIDKYNQLLSTNESIKQDLVDTTKELIKYKSFNQVLNQKLAESDKQLQEQVLKNSKNLEEKQKAFEEKIAKLQKTINDLKKQKAKIQAYVDSKEIEHDKVVKQLELQRIETKSLRNEIASKIATMKSLKGQIQTLEANLAATKETATKTNEYVSSQKLYITKLTNENTSLKEELKNTKKMLRDCDKKTEIASKENFQLKMFLQEKINEKNKLTSELEDAKAALDVEKKNVAAAKENIRDGITKINQLGEVIEIKDSTIKQKESQIKVKEAAIEELKEQNRRAQEQIASLKSMLVKKTSSSLILKQNITDLQNQLLSLKDDLAAAQKTANSKDEAISAKVEEASKLKDALRIALTEKEAIKENITKLTSDNKNLSEKISNLEETIKKLESADNDTKAKFAELNDLNATKQAENNKLKMELAKAKMELDSKETDIAILNEQVIALQNKLNIKAAPLVRVKNRPKKNIPFTQNKVVESTMTGTLYRIKSKSSYITHALVDNNRKPLCYVHFSTPASQYERKHVKISGLLRTVKGWKAPIIDASTITFK